MFGWLESRYWKIISIHLRMPPFSKPSYPEGKQVTAVSSVCSDAIFSSQQYEWISFVFLLAHYSSFYPNILTSGLQGKCSSVCRLSHHNWAERLEQMGSAFCHRVFEMYLVHSSCLNVCEIDLVGVMMCSVRPNESDEPKRSLLCLYNVHRKMNEGCLTVLSCSHTFIHWTHWILSTKC